MRYPTGDEESKEEEEQERAIGGEEEKCWQQGVFADGNDGTWHS